jgi:hypothetical protein
LPLKEEPCCIIVVSAIATKAASAIAPVHHHPVRVCVCEPERTQNQRVVGHTKPESHEAKHVLLPCHRHT